MVGDRATSYRSWKSGAPHQRTDVELVEVVPTFPDDANMSTIKLISSRAQHRMKVTSQGDCWPLLYLCQDNAPKIPATKGVLNG